MPRFESAVCEKHGVEFIIPGVCPRCEEELLEEEGSWLCSCGEWHPALTMRCPRYGKPVTSTADIDGYIGE